jgi:diguanylate cyclase (GGDEF)-like protein
MQQISALSIFDTLCPMHLVLNATGHIVHMGPTLRKLSPDENWRGRRLLELMELKRPRIDGTMSDLCALAGLTLHLALRAPPRTELKAVLQPLTESVGFGPPGGAILNLSFGISIVDAVRDFGLSNSDFAVTDLAMELLYLVEAKSAAMEASRKLNLRLQGAKIAAEEQAFTDTLTGLKNRRALEHVLTRLVEAESDFALMNIDLDYFKTVNDTLGHAAGDHVLQKVARIMVEETRSEDTIVRNGGDEFVIVLPNFTSGRRLSEIAARLIARLEQPIEYEGELCRISASIGAVLTRQYAQPSAERMMEDADVALYAAKNAGRGRHMIFDPSMRQPSGA